MPADRVNKTQAFPFPDYPAAHSMDTTWFAVDENGEIGEFDTGGRGSAPLLEGMEPASIEEQVRYDNLYTKAYVYHEQYSAITDYFRDEPDDEDFKMPVHQYEPVDEADSLFYWRSSPQKPLKLKDLPKYLRSERYFLRLKNYDFASREPVNIYDHAKHCYREWSGRAKTYPESFCDIRTTSFPVPEFLENWYPNAWKESLPEKDDTIGRGFFAMDDIGCLALFMTDRFGAIPLEKYPGHPLKVEEKLDITIWLDIIRKAKEEVAFPVIAQMREQAEQIWEEKGPSHWLEYPFGPASPRLYGFYQYDASWHYPIPYLRVGAPGKPLHYDLLDRETRDLIKPVHLPGVLFAEADMVQPFELVPSFSISRDYYDEDGGWAFPQLWIDSKFERIQSCHEFMVFKGSAALLLKRARLYIDMINRLTRH